MIFIYDQKVKLLFINFKIDVCSKTSSVKRLERILFTDICIDKITYTSQCSYELSPDDKNALSPEINAEFKFKPKVCTSQLNGAVLWKRQKNQVICHTRLGVARQRSLPCSKAISAEH